MRYSAMFGRAAVAAVLALSLGVSTGAQTYNAIDSGGPLWWLPENDGSYSRHHDRWYISTYEAYNDGSPDPWRHATSFPTLDRDKAWETAVVDAPPNSACDLQNGTVYINVGPPHDDSDVPQVRTVRTPTGAADPDSPVAGLQMSLHIGEWWQGLKYRGYFDHPQARALKFNGSRSSYDPDVFGWFDVRMRDGSGTVRRPPLYESGGYEVDFINLARVPWRLRGGGWLSMPCVGISMVQMHGVRDGGTGGAFPLLPTGADGGECWSSARALVLRANSEARCEPNLSERYAYTERFYDLFDAASSREAPLWMGGGDLGPEFPPDYDGPYLFARRGEVAVFTVSELAQTAAPPVPWTSLSYPGGGANQGAQSSAALRARFANRMDPFGGATYGAGTMSLPVQDSADPNARECIEMGEAGWDAATGTLQVDCAHGRENSPMTGNVNRAVNAYGAVERSREAGPVDNSAPFGGVAVARRPGRDPWAPPAGFGWFEHGNATLGCLFLEADVDPTMPSQAVEASEAWSEQVDDYAEDYAEALLGLVNCGRDPFCRSQELARAFAARRGARRALRYAYGWDLIGDYRAEVVSEMRTAFRTARPYGYLGPRRTLRAVGRNLGAGGNACVTGPGGTGYNEALMPSLPAFERSGAGAQWAGDSALPPAGGDMWYGPAFEARGAHQALDRGDPYSQHTNAIGRTTPYSEAELPPGVEYPEELRRVPNYNNNRMGTSVWRDFACGVAHDGYYGAGLYAVGPSTMNPRSFGGGSTPAPGSRDGWWRRTDPRIDLTDADPNVTRRFSSGTPCVGDPDYDVLGSDGTERCFQLVPLDPDLNVPNRGDRFTGGKGAYSSAAAGVIETGYYRLEYSGDGATDTGRSGVSMPVRPVSYRLIDGSEVFGLDLRSSFFNLRLGYRSLDVERSAIWSGYGGWSNPGRGSSWLVTGEAYEGLSPGGCAVGGCNESQVPLDWGRLEHQGPLSWYGAIVPGGTGGCMLAVDRAGGVPSGVSPEGSVLEEPQRIVCLLPLDVVPDGRCPGENLR